MTETGGDITAADAASPWPLILVAALLVLGIGAALATSAPAGGQSAQRAAPKADPAPAGRPVPSGTHLPVFVTLGAITGLVGAIGLLMIVSDRVEQTERMARSEAPPASAAATEVPGRSYGRDRVRRRTRSLEASPERRDAMPHDRHRREAVSEPASLRDAS